MTAARRRDDDACPTQEEVREARRIAGISQDRAAELVHLNSHARWSEYERGIRRIDIARFELFRIKTGQHPDYVPRGQAITG